MKSIAFLKCTTVWTVNDVLGPSITLDLGRSIPHPWIWVDPYPIIEGMDWLKKRVWIESRCHWRSTHVIVCRGVDSFFNQGGLEVVWGAKSAHPSSNRVSWYAEFRGGSGPLSPSSSYTSGMDKIKWRKQSQEQPRQSCDPFIKLLLHIVLYSKYFSHFMDLVNNSFWWNRSVNRAVERTMQTIAPPSFSCHKIVSSMSNNEGGETAIMSRKKRDVIYIFSHPPFKRSFLCVWEKNQYSLFYCFSKLETKETIMSRKKGILQSCA